MYLSLSCQWSKHEHDRTKRKSKGTNLLITTQSNKWKKGDLNLRATRTGTLKSTTTRSEAYPPIIPTLKRKAGRKLSSKASLGYTAKFSLKENKQTKQPSVLAYAQAPAKQFSEWRYLLLPTKTTLPWAQSWDSKTSAGYCLTFIVYSR